MLFLTTGSSAVPYLKKRMTHKLGWMALIPSGQKYNWFFQDADHITNITYDAKFYGFGVRETHRAAHAVTHQGDAVRAHVVRPAFGPLTVPCASPSRSRINM